mmetsp:Transcript_4151/g.11412  ORF Transcript_4151/g.11412 Transcript_4151/m.11412 type:complete len:80 (+) Transcript_4151:110-349(+)
MEAQQAAEANQPRTHSRWPPWPQPWHHVNTLRTAARQTEQCTGTSEPGSETPVERWDASKAGLEDVPSLESLSLRADVA